MARTVGAKDTKPRQKAAAGSKPSDKSPIIQDHNPDLPEGYNTRRIRFMQAILPTEPLVRDDVEEMERRFAFYLEMCAQWDMKVGNMAAYAAIGIDKADAYEWSNRNLGNPARTAFIICNLQGTVFPRAGIRAVAAGKQSTYAQTRSQCYHQ